MFSPGFPFRLFFYPMYPSNLQCFMNALVYVDIDQGIHEGNNESSLKRKMKKLLGFSFYINIENFEAFLRNLNLSPNCLFWRCDDLNQNYE